MFKQNKRSEGFTLVELLVVIAIIGLLSTLSIIALNNARMKARDAVRTAAVKQMQTALELYYSDAGGYPCTASTTMGTPPNGQGGTIKYKGTIYMGIIPTNPAPTNDGNCAGTNAPYTYTAAATYVDQSTYTLQYCLGGASGGVPAGSHTATPIGIMNP